MYPIEDSLLYKEPERRFPLPPKPNKFITLPIPNDVISPAMRVHGFCSMLSETLKLETCTFEEFYFALNNKSDALHLEAQIYIALLTVLFEDEYDEDEESSEERVAMMMMICQHCLIQTTRQLWKQT